MAHYHGVDEVAREVTKRYRGVDNVARNITKAYHEVDGVARLYFSGGLGSLAVGSSVYLEYNGGAAEFLVVHQGNPDPAIYDASCDGTWLLSQFVVPYYKWDETDNEYYGSNISTYTNYTFRNAFSSGIQSIIKEVKLPYTNGTGTGGSLATGSDGIPQYVFSLSYTEVGFVAGAAIRVNIEGAVLDYFKDATDDKRIGYYGANNPKDWWLRSPYTKNTTMAWYVTNTGIYDTSSVFNNKAFRLALVLPKETLVDENFNVIA